MDAIDSSRYKLIDPEVLEKKDIQDVVKVMFKNRRNYINVCVFSIMICYAFNLLMVTFDYSSYL